MSASNPTYLHGDKRYAVRAFAVTQPAAGADFSQTVPAGLQWRIRAVFVKIVTSATVASRQLTLQFKDDQGNLLFQCPASTTQAASLTGLYSFFPTAPWNVVGTTNFVAPIPPDLTLADSFVIASSTASIQTGDQLQNIVILLEEAPSKM